jgi:predicted permease
MVSALINNMVLFVLMVVMAATSSGIKIQSQDSEVPNLVLLLLQLLIFLKMLNYLHMHLDMITQRVLKKLRRGILLSWLLEKLRRRK